MRETWYVLEDGRVVHPNDCVGDERGELRHTDGTPVARRGGTYSSRGVDLRDMVAANEKPAPADREMKPAGGGRGYRTRAARAE